MSDVTLKAELGLVSYDDVQSAALTMCPTGHALHHTERFQHLVQTTSVSSCGVVDVHVEVAADDDRTRGCSTKISIAAASSSKNAPIGFTDPGL